MSQRRIITGLTAALLALVMALGVWSFAAAQDNNATAFLGIAPQAATNGVLVGQVEPNSPAEKAGLQANDVITAIDGKAVTFDTIHSVVASYKVGDTITLSVTRGSNTLSLTATLAAAPTETPEATEGTQAEGTPEASAPEATPQVSGQTPVLGVTLMDGANGPVISEVVPNSAADKAGLKADDVITKINDTTVASASDAANAIHALKVGDTVTITVTRDGSSQTVTATLEGASTVSPAQPITPATPNPQTPVLGVTLQDSANGPAIGQVLPGSAADKAGLKAGDVITKINDTDVKTVQDAATAIHALKVGDTVTITITRDGSSQTVTATLEAAPTAQPGTGTQPTMPNTQPATPNAQTPVLGVTLTDGTNGALIGEVAPNSAADKAGLKAGDLITKINDTTVTNAGDAADAIHALKVGDTATITITRDGSSQTVTATLEAAGASAPALPSTGGQAQPGNDNGAIGAQTPVLGVGVQDGTNGPTVEEVLPNSPAEKAGLKVNDVITKINDTDVKTASDVVTAIRALKVGDNVSITITRDGSSQTVQVTLAAGSTLPELQQLGIGDGQPFGMSLGQNGFGIVFNGNDQSWQIQGLPQDSPLYTAGLRQGDVIKTFDGKTYDPASLATYLSGLDQSKKVTLSVDRNGSTQDITISASDLMNLTTFGFGPGGNFVFPFGGNGNGNGFGIPFPFPGLPGQGVPQQQPQNTQPNI